MIPRRICIWSIVFWLVIVFQVSVLPDTLGMVLEGRVVNLAVLLFLFVCSLYVIVNRQSERALLLYCFPLVLIIIGYSVNILRSGRIEALSHMGLLLPWFAALSVPFARGFDLNRYWNYFYRFMLFASAVALLEYAAVFYGLITPVAIETKRGPFMKGILTIFFGLDNDAVNDRMYGVFPEPGTFAMFLLPALAYTLVYRKILATALFLACMILTSSLGGYFALGIVLLVYCYWIARQRGAITALYIGAGIIVVLSIAFGILYEFFVTMYVDRGASASVRESNVSLFFSNFLRMLFEAPLGLGLKGEALSTFENNERFYFGSNFSFATMMVVGGVISFLGFTMFFIVNVVCWLRGVVRADSDKALACAYISFPALATFVFQRVTIFELALYGFLLATPILLMLQRGPIRKLDFYSAALASPGGRQ